MEQPKIAILDGDILAYRAAYSADTEGIDYLQDRLIHDINEWTPMGCKPVVALSCRRSENFRRDFWGKYKAHRDGRPDPDCLNYALEMLPDISTVKKMDRLEADDIMGIGASSGSAIAVTIDKDLKGVPGWLWNPDKDAKPYLNLAEDADKFFARQIITGDTTDGIPGLPKKGDKFFEKDILFFDREDWFQEIWWAYEEMGYDYEYFLSQARCVRILRIEDYNPDTKEILLWDMPYNRV